jgi:hypothetical protein
MNRFFSFFLRSNPRMRVIDRSTHAVLDYLTVAAFAFFAGYHLGRNNRAATTAIVNGAAVLGASMFTDYPGSLARLIPFETHGKIDVAQMSMAAGMPLLLGFAGDSAALPFYMQAINELLVVRATDWQGTHAASQVGADLQELAS